MSNGQHPEDRLRRLADGVAPFSADVDQVKERGRRRRRRGWVGATAGTLVATVLIGGAGMVLLSDDDAEVADTTTSEVIVTTSVPQVTETTVATPPTTGAAAPSTTIPTEPAPDPDAIVLAVSAEEIGVQMFADAQFTLNPFLDSAPLWRLVGWLDPVIQRGAWQPAPNGDPVADLVESLPLPGDGTAVLGPQGNLTLTYQIREDARWSDGQPVVADDFRLTLEIIQDPHLPIREDWRDLHSAVTSFRTTGPDGFEVTLTPGDGRYQQLFPVVVPAHVVVPATFAEDWNEQMWPSAAPFVLAEFFRFERPRAGQMVLNRNPEEVAAPRAIVIDFYQRDERGDSLAIEAFRNREADVLGPTSSWEYLRDAVEPIGQVDTDAFIWEVLFLQPGEQRLITNPASRLDELAVRRAVLQAIDRRQLATVGEPIGSLVEFFVDVENPGGAWGGVEFNPDAVTALGEPVPLLYSTTAGELTIDIGTEVVELLTAAGFDVSADFAGDSSAAFDNFNRGDFELFAIRLVRTPGTEGLGDLFEVFRADAPRTEDFPGFPQIWGDNNPAAAEFSRVLDEFAAELDPGRRIELLIEAENMLVDQMIVIPLVKRTGESWVFHQDRITGPAPIDLLEGWLWNLGDWRRVDG